ncbi:hypothetical protein H6G17_25855 [Chroococcidiopsis sp. FACHB-1243]|uniref:hypothetical protein n=1 Tax=Chroococcidiopsis sp. [FACHB-1243] TaxID=2692781 RepID=UPI00177B4234|nr:hypothetical protein [Chroococcidiopsis sp. [FACHB-1243]]MBD2308896.1 hypothetical protein [Chroococcidiopsis sp. [FACHB-1243]]
MLGIAEYLALFSHYHPPLPSLSSQGAGSSELRGAMKAERKVQRRLLRSCFALRSYEAKADRDR